MGKQVVQQRKKRTREERERERAEAVADVANRQDSLRIRDPQAQGEPQQLLCRSGRTRQPQTSPQSRSGPRTRGGSSQRTAGRAQQQHSGSDREAAGQDSDAEEEPPQVELLDLRGIPGPKVKRLRYVTPETWFPERRDIGVDRRFHTLLQESFYHAYC